MKKLITKIRHKLIRWLGGEIPTLKPMPPLVFSEHLPLTVIEFRECIPAEEYEDMKYMLRNGKRQEIERILAQTVGKEIVDKCGVKQCFNNDTNMFVFKVAVEVTERSLKGDDENGQEA